LTKTKLFTPKKRKVPLETHDQTLISDEENLNFDKDNENIDNLFKNANQFINVDQFINENINRTQSYEASDLNRLSNDNELLKPFTSRDIVNKINSFKNKAPGASKINKVVLVQLSSNTIQGFGKLLNLAVSMGHFPVVFKIAILRFVSKPNRKLPAHFTIRNTPENIYKIHKQSFG